LEKRGVQQSVSLVTEPFTKLGEFTLGLEGLPEQPMFILPQDFENAYFEEWQLAPIARAILSQMFLVVEKVDDPS
jgi:hypothetical protein